MHSEWYEANAASVTIQYEAIDPAALHAWLLDLLPDAPAAVLDVGAGSGRDAAWLASLGHEVVAAEPSAAMRGEAMRLHPDPRIRWTDDALPDLHGAVRSGLSFNAVLLSAVWQHVHSSQRARAFRKMASVLKPGGLLAITLRHGPDPGGCGMHTQIEFQRRGSASWRRDTSARSRRRRASSSRRQTATPARGHRLGAGALRVGTIALTGLAHEGGHASAHPARRHG